MKKLILPLLFAVSSLGAATIPPPKKSSPDAEAPQPPPEPKHEKYKFKKIEPKIEETETPSGITFNLPGIIGLQEGHWKGTDHLLNLTNNIHVAVDIMVGDDVKLPFDEAAIQSQVESTLVKAGFKIDGLTRPGEPPLPYLHFLVMVQKCDQSVAAYIQARLFEKVKLDRVQLPVEVAFQAITWEDENLLIIEGSQLQKDLFDQLDEMAGYFVQRYNFFEKETARLKAR